MQITVLSDLHGLNHKFCFQAMYWGLLRGIMPKKYINLSKLGGQEANIIIFGWTKLFLACFVETAPDSLIMVECP